VDPSQLEAKIRQALASAESELHTEQLARQLGIARHTASKYLAILRAKGEIRSRKVGNAKLWSVAPAAEATTGPSDAGAERVFLDLHPPLDDGGAVWLRAHPRPGETEVAWEILDIPAGTVGEMRAPLDLRPLHIGTDFMIVLRSDTLDVERVGLFDLLRENPGS